MVTTPLFRIPIRLQLVVIVTIVALPAAGIIISSGIQQKNRAIHDAQTDTKSLVDRIASEQRIMVASTRQLVVSLSQLPEIKEKDASKVNTFLSHILKLHPNFSNIFIADSTGNIWASAVPYSHPTKVDDRRFFKSALASGILSSGEYQVGRVIKKPTLNLGYPYRNNDGTVAGVICAGIALEDYRLLLKRTQLPTRAEMALIDHRGLILLSSDAPKTSSGQPLDPAILKEMREGPDSATVTDFSIDGGSRRIHRYVSYEKLRIEGEQLPYMYIRVGIPVESVLFQAQGEIMRSLSLFSFALICAFITAWYIGRCSIADRIALLERASESLANGDLKVRVSDLMIGGELGKLGASFDAMAKRLASREESLSNSQRFLNAVIDTEPDCVKMLDADGRVLMMNQAGLVIVGAKSLDQIKGQSIFSCISDAYREAFEKLTRDVFQGKSGSLEFEADNLAGKHVWLGTHVVPFRNDQGEIVSLLGITRDITDRKLADQALRQREADLRKAQQIARLGSWSYSLPDALSWSDELYRIYGVSPETYTPTVESVIELIHPEDRAAMRGWIKDCVTGKNPGALVFRIICPDGTLRIIDGRGELTPYGRDGRIYMTGTAQDITEREKAKEKLARSESALRATFEQAAVGMARVGPDGHWLEVNQRLCEIVGYARDELLSGSYRDIMHPDDLDPNLGQISQVLAGATNSYAEELRCYRKDLSIIWITFTVGAVRNPSGAIDYCLAVVEEITKRKRAEERLVEEQRTLEELNGSLANRIESAVSELRRKDQILIVQGRQAALGEMIGNIAHQWRQPLNTLALIIQELCMTYDRDENYKQSLDSGVKKAMRLILHMSKTIDDFSNYFKPDKDKMPFSINRAVHSAVNLIEASLANSEIAIEVIESAEISVNGYANEYSQVLLNILINCRDAFVERSVEGKRVILVTVSAQNDKSVVTVADNAGGISETILEKIFDPYFTTKGPDKGTGIGLYMAKTIIEKNMDGILSVRNAGDGAEFSIRL